MEQSRPLIVIIEDDDSVRMLLERALSTSYEVEAIATGPDAMIRILEPPVPALLICDVMLPGVDGLTIARRAKSTLWSRVPILFLTARTTPQDVIKGIQAGARQYITKPFKLKDLEERVKKVLGQ